MVAALIYSGYLKQQKVKIMRYYMKSFLALALVVMLTACATPYKSNGLMGGFSETQLSDDIYQISFRGNGYTSKERASDFALLRSANKTLEQGKRYFLIVDSLQDQRVSSVTTPVQAHTTGFATHNGMLSGNTYSGSSFGSANTTISGGDVLSIVRPKTTYMIKILDKKPADGVFYLDAAMLKASLEEKYQIDNAIDNEPVTTKAQ